MKVTCQSCQAKYTIADEKVRGKIAKIRCKKCGTTIIVDGADGQPTVASSSTEPPLSAPPGQSVEEPWSIVVAEGDERQVPFTQLAELYAAGTINHATLAWKQGMPDWQPMSEIPGLRSLTEPPRSMRAPNGDASAAGSVEFQAPASIAPRTRPGEGVAARRVARAGAADLFGGGNDDVTTSVSASAAGARPIDDKPTGARNENSVLFSLSALTGGAAPTAASGFGHAGEANPSSARADLSSLVRSAEKPAVSGKNKLDDIMNLGGGGLYSPALMAPSLTAPSVEYSATGEAASSSGKRKNKGLLMLGVGGIVILGGAVAAFSAMSSPHESPTGAASGAAVTNVGPSPVAPPETAPVAPPPEPSAPPSEPIAAATTLTPGQAATKPEPEKRVAAPRAERVEKVDKPDRPAAPAPAPAPERQAAPAPAAASTADFDRAAALSALSTAATASQACNRPDGPTGAGRISVTFASNGSATTAAVEGPPFAGTPVGGCVAARFRSSHVPPFAGSPVTVHKSFNIN
jgi:predicted Zn finger-like uncharacterized protein